MRKRQIKKEERKIGHSRQKNSMCKGLEEDCHLTLLHCCPGHRVVYKTRTLLYACKDAWFFFLQALPICAQVCFFYEMCFHTFSLWLCLCWKHCSVSGCDIMCYLSPMIPYFPDFLPTPLTNWSFLLWHPPIPSHPHLHIPNPSSCSFKGGCGATGPHSVTILTAVAMYWESWEKLMWVTLLLEYLKGSEIALSKDIASRM